MTNIKQRRGVNKLAGEETQSYTKRSTERGGGGGGYPNSLMGTGKVFDCGKEFKAREMEKKGFIGGFNN